MCTGAMRGGRLRLTDGGDGSDNLAELEFIKDGGLTSGIQTDLEID